MKPINAQDIVACVAIIAAVFLVLFVVDAINAGNPLTFTDLLKLFK